EWWYYGAISIGVATGKNEVVKTTKSANVLIYPIPTLDEINIDNIGNLKQIEMFTQTGKLTTINFSDIEKHNVGYKFSTKKYGFSPGIYFIKIVHDDKITYRKVLIN
ncbi:MAG: T9SS type A sorting domain-containing protein, partial [Bacteroidia bacterium]|nr:T9SS type A sorting domain-containing protein [Bacteroidia bacterium]